MSVDVSVRVGGEAGQGMQSIGLIMGKVFARHGYHVFINQDVESRIRGGHSYVQIRIADTPVAAIDDEIDLLIALDRRTIDEDLPDLSKDGVMIYDGPTAEFETDDPRHLSVPLQRIAQETAKSGRMANSVATGSAFALLGFELMALLKRMEEEFGDKGARTVEDNRRCARAGHEHVLRNYKDVFGRKIPPSPLTDKRLLMNGSQAIALGAVCSGLKFYSGYPMSPSTAIMETVASMAREYNIVVEPAEDEIAAVNMAIGASFAGVRAMTATSGGGFCLMVEGLGLAAMTETPLVIVNAQRPGPSTGLPTRTEQADLHFVIHASHGEFPRAVFAPGNAEEAFYLVSKAFNLADRYQTPVIVLGDQHLNDSFFTIDELDLSRIVIDRGRIVNGDSPAAARDYRRYAWDDSGVTARILPGQSAAVQYADSDEHTETGHITESAAVRKKLMDKRMRKVQGIQDEMGLPRVYPEGSSDIVLLGWGSTQGAIREAVDILNREGLSTGMMHFSEVYPFPAGHAFGAIPDETRIVAIENNYTGQFADLFHLETGRPVFHKILKYDGRPFSAIEIAARVKDAL